MKKNNPTIKRTEDTFNIFNTNMHVQLWELKHISKHIVQKNSKLLRISDFLNMNKLKER